MDNAKFRFEDENPYDLLAEWIPHLRSLNKAWFTSPDLRKTMQLPDDLDEEVERLLRDLPYIGSRDEKHSALRFGIPQDEKKAVQQWRHFGDFFYMLRLVSGYTERLLCDRILSSPYFFSITHNQDGTEREFESLNTNVEETGVLILPKVPTINDPLAPAGEEDEAAASTKAAAPVKHWAADRMDGIQTELSNVYYVETEELCCKGRRYRVMNSVLRRDMFPENKKVFRIAVCPIVKADLLNVRTYCEKTGDGNQRRCSVEGLKSEELVHDKLYAAIFEASKEGADAVLCPEMLGDETTAGLSFFESVREKLRFHGLPMPGVLFLPTWWHDYRNELYVRNSSGNLLGVQQKQTPYPHNPYKDEGSDELYAEDLRDPEPVVHMVHIPEIGRMTFPICKDFLEEDYIRMMLRQLRTTFLICPSYSPAKTQFDLTAPGAIPYGCYTIWCNTCAAYWKSNQPPGHIGLAAGPQDPAEGICLLKPACKGNCGTKDTPCIFMVEISTDRSAQITCHHIFN